MKEYIEREEALKKVYDANWYHITTHGTLCIGAADEESALYKAKDIFKKAYKFQMIILFVMK